MEITGPPTCSPCSRRNEVSLATWVLNDDSVYNWYLCDRHARIVGVSTLNLRARLKQLPDAKETRSISRRDAQ